MFHPGKNGGIFLIFFTHENVGGKFLKIFFTHEKMEADSWKYFSPMENWRQIPEKIFHPWKIGGKFLKICFTHEKFGGKFGTPKNPKIKSSQNQNPFCPNCRRGFFMPEKGVPAPFGALPAHFFRGLGKSKNCTDVAHLPWWAHGPYSPALGPLLLSTRGGAIGRWSCCISWAREVKSLL